MPQVFLYVPGSAPLRFSARKPCRHPQWRKGTLVKTYFPSSRGHTPRFTDETGQTLICAGDTPFRPHTPIEAACNPYDPAWQQYLRQHLKASPPKGGYYTTR